MKTSINLFEREPENQGEKERKKKILQLSEFLILLFLLFNLIIFGFYWFLVKNTADTREAIKKEEEKIISLAPTENLYRALMAKISLLGTIWQNPLKPEDILKFSESLSSERVIINTVSFTKEGLTTMKIKVSDSQVLEDFVNLLAKKEKNGLIKNIVINGTQMNEKKEYNFTLTFKFLEFK